MIALPLVLIARQYLQIRLNVETTDEGTRKRNDVIDFVPDAGHLREQGSRLVKGCNGVGISPLRSSLDLVRCTLSDKSDLLLWIVSCPLSIPLSIVLGILHPPLDSIFTSVFLVALIPILMCAGVSISPSSASFGDAYLAGKGSPVNRCSAYMEVFTMKLLDLANIASFQPNLSIQWSPCVS